MDDSTQTFEVLGLSSDDTAVTNLVSEMQDLGIRARCQAAHDPFTSDQIADGFLEIGYRPEPGLYQRLTAEFERRKLSARQANWKS